MSLLFETILVEDGVARNMVWHERRMSHALREVWRINEPMVLEPLIHVPPELCTGMVRCNVLYGPSVESITYTHYEMRMVRSLKLVNCDTIDYHLKFTDRFLLESLLAQRGACDEIIIVKNGFLTDTSMSNILFTDNEKWVTPANPLLKGTCRERLIKEGRVTEQEIRPGAIAGFAGCSIINAMRDPDEEMMIPVSQIFH